MVSKYYFSCSLAWNYFINFHQYLLFRHFYHPIYDVLCDMYAIF
jgi:hypothetical protein